MFRSVWLDGRTARGMRAIKPFAKQLGLPEGTQSAVIFGGNHAARAQEFMESDQQADEAIGVFAEELLTAAKDIYADYYHIPPARIPQQFTTNFLDYFTRIDMLTITDPGGSTVQPNFFTKILPHYVTASRPIHSPQLENAIKHLRPGH